MHTIQLNPGEPAAAALKADFLRTIQAYSHEHHAKFVGCGITDGLVELCPDICSFLWSALDIVVVRFKVKTQHQLHHAATVSADVDEQADSAARKCIMHFGPGHNPALSIGFRNRVEPDIGGKAELVSSLESYRNTVHEGTWNSVLRYADELKTNDTKVAFFSATPQGGGVALMRHAMIRFFRLLGVDVQWFVDVLCFCLFFFALMNIISIYLTPTPQQVHPKAKPQGLQNHKDQPQHPTGRR